MFFNIMSHGLNAGPSREKDEWPFLN